MGYSREDQPYAYEVVKAAAKASKAKSTAKAATVATETATGTIYLVPNTHKTTVVPA